MVGTDESARNSITWWKRGHAQHVVATKTVMPPKTMGEHHVDGITFEIGGLGTVRWRSDCAQCVRQGQGAFAPSHAAMPRCRSGGRNHCTCDGCF
ncbi:hypothetical protein B7R22_16965 [Subtercola boreus]|uniref:Uncharacterized protein n=1 Tax=Subtercola boreus TaxID=120213 RepID=A0A3E0VQ60_9MICO|nr:hypothetical protein B7R22_16965 [Subtercola boreus]